MLNTETVKEGIRDLVNIYIKTDITRIDIDEFLNDIIAECVDLRTQLPRKSYNKYLVERLNNIKGIMKEGFSSESDLDELIEELTEENDNHTCDGCHKCL